MAPQWLCPGLCFLVYGRENTGGFALAEIVGGIRSEKQVRITQDLPRPRFWTGVFPGLFSSAETMSLSKISSMEIMADIEDSGTGNTSSNAS